jgi:hypothetical protein
MKEADGARGLPLSVVIPTTQPWPEAQACLNSVYDEARSLGAEVIVADGDARALPPDHESRYPEVIHLTEQGASVFRLRAIGMAAARGEVVAATEDHCQPAPGWCEGHVRAHAEHPGAAVVGGPVRNGATQTLTAWASFLLNHSPFVPPIASGEGGTVDHSNVSLKRRFVPRTPSEEGKAEVNIGQRLRRAGETTFIDERILVSHVQWLGIPQTFAIHFHSGRSTSGLRVREGMRATERVAGLGMSLLLGPGMFVQTVRRVRRNRAISRRKLAAVLPALALLSFSTAVGVTVGYIAGPGSSPPHLR